MGDESGLVVYHTCGNFSAIIGLWMLHYFGMPFTWDGAWLWVKWTLALYALAGVCWLPVVWLQIKMARQVAATYVAKSDVLPTSYKRYQFWWELLGYPALCATLVMYCLMVLKPM